MEFFTKPTREKPGRPAKTGALLLCALCAALILYALCADENTAGQKQDLAQVLSQIEGAGQVTIYIGQTQQAVSSVFSDQTVPAGGVVVVAQGAQDPYVAFALADAACTALGLDPSKVSVAPMAAP